MPESLYTSGDVPSGETAESPGPTVGTVIVVQTAGQITHLKWYCPAVAPSNQATLPFILYDATTQAELRRAVPGSLTTSAWNTVAITPVNVTANQRLLACVYSGSRYAFTGGYFVGTAKTSSGGNLVAPATVNDPIGNGRFRASAEGIPLSTFNGNNYWTDVVFEPSAGGTTPVTSRLTAKWRVYSKVTSRLTSKWQVFSRVISSLTVKWRVFQRVTSTFTVKWKFTQPVTSALTSKWRVFQKVSSRLTSKWYNLAPPVPPATISPVVLEAQRKMTLAFIADDPTQIDLVPRSRTRTNTGGYTYAVGPPRASQTVKMVLLSNDQRPTITVAGVERVADYHLVGRWDMEIAVGDIWDAPDGTTWEVLGFTEGWDYMTKAFVGRHIPREVRP